MNKFSSTFAVALLPTLLVAGAPFVHAQYYSYPGTGSTYGSPTYSACVTITSPLTIGSNDALTGGQVSQLQQFLVRTGILSPAYVTGYYGSITAGAVSQLQASHGISPTGVVGPLTRAAIQQVSCGGTTGYIPPTQPVPPVYPNNPYYPGYSYGVELDSLTSNNYGNGLTITLKGYGFDLVNNTVYFDGISVPNVASVNGTQLTFNVPPVTSNGTYQIYVTNARGTSNTLSYNVTNIGTNNCWYNGSYTNTSYCNCQPVYNNNCGYSNIHIDSLSQTSGYAGTNITIYGGGFQGYTTVYLGNNTVATTYANGNSITFTVPSISAGTYSLYASNSNGQSSNSVQFTVLGGNNYGTVNIYSLSPNQGAVGTTITINGTGFSQYGNIVHFGNGGTANVQSYNGNTIYFTIPSYISPCNVNTNGSVCPMYAQQVTPGTYPVYVTNQNGQSSNTLNFQVFSY